MGQFFKSTNKLFLISTWALHRLNEIPVDLIDTWFGWGGFRWGMGWGGGNDQWETSSWAGLDHCSCLTLVSHHERTGNLRTNWMSEIDWTWTGEWSWSRHSHVGQTLFILVSKLTVSTNENSRKVTTDQSQTGDTWCLTTNVFIENTSSLDTITLYTMQAKK